MVDSSHSPQTSLEALLREIEATPQDYWGDLLVVLRRFRQDLPATAPTVINAEQARKNQAAIALLDSWLSEDEDAEEHRQFWEFLKTPY